MSFAQPIWLYCIPLLLLLFGGMVAYGLRRRDALLDRFAASRLLNQLTEQASLSRTWIKAACILLAVLALALALARPQLGVEWTERKARGLDIVFVIDSSKSMLATDLRPSRLERAKLAVRDLLERLESDRVGLVAFAGQAFLQTPPTLDYAAFRESLDAVDPTIMTSGGSDLGNAIREAAEAFPSENNVKVVVLLTDGEDLAGGAAPAAEVAREAGIQIFAIGIGTPEGAYLQIPNQRGIEEFVRDADGQPVRSQLDEPTLQSIAQATGGSYRRLSNDSLDQLYSSVLATLPREERQSELQEVRIERFQWALSAALILLVMEFLIRRRRASAVQAGLIIAAMLCLPPNQAAAQTNPPAPADPATGPAEPIQPPEAIDPRQQFNRAYEALSSGDYAGALQGYETAIAQTEDRQLQADALYNMGHATHQLGRRQYGESDLAGALEAMKKAEDFFRSARELNPRDSGISADLEQATRVRETVEQLIEDQKQQEQQEQKSDQSEQQDQSKQSDQSEQQDQSEPSDQSGQSDQSDQSEQSKQQEQSDQSDQPQQSDQTEPPDQSASSNQSDSSDQSGQPEQNEQEEPSDSVDQSQPSDPAENGASQSEDPASTRDPVDDLPETQADESEASEASEEPSADEAEQAPVPEAGAAGEIGDEAAGQAGMSGEPVPGMTEADAAALLDSLRGREQLLPFTDAARNGRSREIRDW